MVRLPYPYDRIDVSRRSDRKKVSFLKSFINQFLPKAQFTRLKRRENIKIRRKLALLPSYSENRHRASRNGPHRRG